MCLSATMKCEACLGVEDISYIMSKCAHMVCGTCLIRLKNMCPVKTCLKVGYSRVHGAPLLSLHDALQAVDGKERMSNVKPVAPVNSNPVQLVQPAKPETDIASGVTYSPGYAYGYLDFETTDRTPATCRIVQIGVDLYRADEKDASKVYRAEPFSTLVKADQPMNEDAAKLTGITDIKLCQASPVSKVLLQFLQWLDQERGGLPVVLIAHNGIEFDFVILFNEMWRWGLHPYVTLKKYGVVMLFDTLKWCRVHIPSHRLIKNDKGIASYKLGDIHESLLKCRFEDAHTALADCMAMKRIMETPYIQSMNPQITVADGHSCMHIKDFANDQQLKRESIDRATAAGVKKQIKLATQTNNLLSFFSTNKRKELDVEEVDAVKKRKVQ